MRIESNRKTPQTDRLSLGVLDMCIGDVYWTWMKVVGELLVGSFNKSFIKGEMSPSQRQAVITLIEKKDQDRCDLKNWRPISLLNVDAKIASKVIAERVKRVLPYLIHENQSGYVPGRSICENIRSILDIMEYTKDNNKPGILFFIDFEKAFDSLEWDFLNKCLELFNFGPEFIRWVNIFYKNTQSCVINNGLCCDYFKVLVYPKFDHFSKKLIFAFSDRSYCNLSFKKNSKKKDRF